MSRFGHLDVDFSASGCWILSIWMLAFPHPNGRKRERRIVAFPQSCLWLSRKLVCGFPAILFVAFPQIGIPE